MGGRHFLGGVHGMCNVYAFLTNHCLVESAISAR